MKILFLNLYYPPDTSATAKTAESFAEALAKEHEVTVICGRPSYDPRERRAWKFSQTENAGAVRVVRVGSTDYPRFQMKRRIFNYLSYVALVVPRALFAPCDVVFAMTDPPFNGIVGAFIALLKRKPFVYNVQDMYPDMAVGGSLVAPGLLARVWESLHRWALRRASKVIAIGDDMRARIIGKGLQAERVFVVRTGVNNADNVPAAIDPDVVQAIRTGFEFVLLHAGNLGFYGAWPTLISAAKSLEKEGVGLVFVGDGAQREELVEAAQGSAAIRFLPFFPAAKIPSVLAAGDLHVITVKRGLEGVVVPSKMYGILAAGKPILSVAPDSADAVMLGLREGWGVAADPGRPSEVVGQVKALLADKNKLLRMSDFALVAAKNYGRREQLQHFLEIFAKSQR